MKPIRQYFPQIFRYTNDAYPDGASGNSVLRSGDYKKLQDSIGHLQYARENMIMKQQLGEGCFGEVFLALATNLPQLKNKEPIKVAVKQLRLAERLGLHSQQVEDFLREGKEMARCDHPRVVKFLAVCTLDFPLLLITEYMNEGDLLGVLHDSRPKMPLQRQLRFAIQVADGMDYLSTELNFIHRDLATRNILVHVDEVSGEMEAKIADFGLSRHLYSTMYQDDFKKPRPLPAKWMALESLIDCIFTTKTDVWSYGVLVWEIMTLGRTPYPGIDNRDVLKEIEENNLRLSEPKDCPSSIYSIILQCTSHKPEHRPSFAELRDQLLILDVQLSPAKNATATMATETNHNGSANHHHDNNRPEYCNEASSVTKQQVVMRRDPSEHREQKERPLSISERIKQLQANAGLDTERVVTRRQNVNRPITTIGKIK